MKAIQIEFMEKYAVLSYRVLGTWKNSACSKSPRYLLYLKECVCLCVCVDVCVCSQFLNTIHKALSAKVKTWLSQRSKYSFIQKCRVCLCFVNGPQFHFLLQGG